MKTVKTFEELKEHLGLTSTPETKAVIQVTRPGEEVKRFFIEQDGGYNSLGYRLCRPKQVDSSSRSPYIALIDTQENAQFILDAVNSTLSRPSAESGGGEVDWPMIEELRKHANGDAVRTALFETIDTLRERLREAEAHCDQIVVRAKLEGAREEREAVKKALRWVQTKVLEGIHGSDMSDLIETKIQVIDDRACGEGLGDG